MQTILGAGGTIGSDLAKELVKYTDRIRLVSRNPKKINASDEIFPADLSDPLQIDEAVNGSDIVYLTVGFEYNIQAWKKNWPTLMKTVIEACKKYHSKLVFFDNVYAYDATQLGYMTEETPYKPVSKKGKVRAEIANMLSDEMKSGSLTGMIVRSADFYGPRNDKSALIETVVKNFIKGKKADWFADANKIHTFTFTPDAVKATALLGNTPEAFNQTWHVPTTSEKLAGKQWIELFAKELHVKSSYRVLPRWLMRGLGIFMPIMRELEEMAYQFDRDYIFDSSKFEKRFGIKATSPQEGARLTIASMK
ncbi:MAG: NAD-dependent epimerase/dehydratase family protein [Chitinophagales bacterium]|nr:NAD-dependent epimerase/dehydratase family protein [Chitinophagales bacterium]